MMEDNILLGISKLEDTIEEKQEECQIQELELMQVLKFERSESDHIQE